MNAIDQKLAALAAIKRPSIALTPTRTIDDVIKMQQHPAISEAREENQMAEINRIIKMPCYRGMDEQEVTEYSRANLLADAYRSGFRFMSTQAEAISGYETVGGGLASIGVGFGKTLASLCIAAKAFAKGIGRAMLLIPPQVVFQLVQHDIKWARSKYPITYPIHILAGRSMQGRLALAKSGRKGLYILTYSLLSTKDTSEVLEAIKPELIIADEAHNLANYAAARTRRVKGYIEDALGSVEFCALSGTITSKSIKDYWHLSRWSLKHNNPLPNSSSMATDWAAVLDAKPSSDGIVSAYANSPLLPLVGWARRLFPHEPIGDDVAGFRRAYRLRLNTTPGVVSSGDSEIGTSLIIENQPIKDHTKAVGWDKLKALGDQVEDQWLTPNGDEIEHSIHTWKWLNEIYGAGFYNQLSWPEPGVVAERKNISETQATDMLEKSKMHHGAGQDYSKALRKFLQDKSFPGCDSPMLVGQEMARHGAKHVGEELYDLWRYHKALDFEGRPERDSSAVRVCDYKITQAVLWAYSLPKNEGGIMWVHHQEVGKWLHERLIEDGVERAIHCPAGTRYNAMILDPDNTNKLIVASITAHGTGKNLQHFRHQHFVQWPRSATIAEQTLGRMHRTGQLADELIVHTNITTDFDQVNFAACLNDSLYIHQTTGNRQKLIYANYNPLPKIIPSTVLAERGLQNSILTKEQQAMLDEKFGEQV